MPSLEYYHQLIARSDMGYGWLMLAVAFGLITSLLITRILNVLARLVTWPFAAVNPLRLHWASSSPAGNLPNVATILDRLPSPLYLILLLGVLMRLPRLFDPLWYDETFSARMASIPLANLPEALRGDVHPPLHYLIQWLVVHVFGVSAFTLRLPALVAGVVLIWLVYRLALALMHSNRTALLSALIVACMPAAIYYSNEARQYALFACLALGLLISILEDRRGWFVLCGALLPLTHNIGYLYLAIMGVSVLLYRRPTRAWIASVILAAMPGFWWLPVMLSQSVDVSDGFWLQPLTLPGVFWPITSMTVTLKLPEPYVLPSYVPILALTMVSLYIYRRHFRYRHGALLLVFMGLVPLALALASVLWRPIYLQRALLPCALCLAIYWALLAQTSPLARWALAFALLVGLAGFYQKPRISTDIAQHVAFCQGADTVYTVNTAGAFIVAYYLPNTPQVLWSGSNDLNQTLPADSINALGFPRADTPDDLRGRICVFQTDNPMTTNTHRQHVASILARYPVIDHKFVEVNEFYYLKFYMLEVP